jgi:hypothetical protein
MHVRIVPREEHGVTDGLPSLRSVDGHPVPVEVMISPEGKASDIVVRARDGAAHFEVVPSAAHGGYRLDALTDGEHALTFMVKPVDAHTGRPYVLTFEVSYTDAEGHRQLRTQSVHIEVEARREYYVALGALHTLRDLAQSWMSQAEARGRAAQRANPSRVPSSHEVDPLQAALSDGAFDWLRDAANLGARILSQPRGRDGGR